MNKEFIPYDLALELKELGFDESCIATYRHDGDFNIVEQNGLFWEVKTNPNTHCAAPLYQQAFRFFREKYFLGHGINPYSLDTHLIDLEDCIFYDIDDVYTYEEAELACLKKIIEIVKNK